ncbi:acyltransferase family protein [Dyella jejuensis]|uniref:acyltransferase family protein n=1 Tax=Dyella jejuensis TaxID=1432009 RepID=UPI00384DDA48
MGALVWLASRHESGILHVLMRGKLASAAGWLGLASLLGAGLLLSANKPYPGFFALIPTCAAALVIASGSCASKATVQRVLSWRPLQGIGRVSYSWYLWHWPVLLLGPALTGSNAPVYRGIYVAMSLLLAFISYRFVESPIRQQRWWLARPRVGYYTAFALVILSVLGFLQWSVGADKAASSPAQMRIAFSHGDTPAIYPMGCDDWYLSDRVRPCVFGDRHAAHTALLLGDSIAGQWFPAVARIFNRPGWRLVVLTKSSCPMVDQSFFYARIGRVYSECANWRKAVLQDMAQLKPDMVLMSSSSTATFTQKEWEKGSASVLRPISEAAAHVYVLRSTPHLPFDGPDCLAGYAGRPSWLLGKRTCNASAADDHADLVYASIQQAARQFGNVETLDLDDRVCPNDKCHAELDGTIVFRDSQHMTATFAASLAPALAARLRLDHDAGIAKQPTPGMPSQ